MNVVSTHLLVSQRICITAAFNINSLWVAWFAQLTNDNYADGYRCWPSRTAASRSGGEIRVAREHANAISELTDAIYQRSRLVAQTIFDLIRRKRRRWTTRRSAEWMRTYCWRYSPACRQQRAWTSIVLFKLCKGNMTLFAGW
mmetsp:Transcript_14216/g.19389  ORF Transcript_14216/g.19389 Transcript_14216/m.19389 type:complete len:143 (-) Transcript_14216:322-750(-)